MNTDIPSGSCAATPSSRLSQPSSAVVYVITVDLDDGQPCPPYIEDGVPWRVTQRRNGRTLWRRVRS
jgi:hypothetical protein